MEDLHLFKHAVGVIYATLINYTAPIKRKLTALQMLKSIFQTGISIRLVSASNCNTGVYQISAGVGRHCSK
jgi:hypothetical protein